MKEELIKRLEARIERAYLQPDPTNLGLLSNQVVIMDCLKYLLENEGRNTGCCCKSSIK